MRRSWPRIPGFALACVPCLLVLGVFGFAFVGFAAIGAWFTDNSSALGAAAVAAVAFAALPWVVYVRNAGEAACDVDPAEEKFTRSQGEPIAATPEGSTVVGVDKR